MLACLIDCMAVCVFVRLVARPSVCLYVCLVCCVAMLLKDCCIVCLVRCRFVGWFACLIV